MNGGRFDFDDGGTYVGGWEEGKAHGHGVCSGPQGKGEYAGAWHYGFEVSGAYYWPSGNTYHGQWQNGKRHGLGVEQRGRWTYKGEWTQGQKGRYGVRNSSTSQARYQGTWSGGYHDGYGTEIYVDGGNYQGQWLRGLRHGYGTRRSATYGQAAKLRPKSHTHASLTSLRSGRGDDENEDEDQKDGQNGRSGFVLKANSSAPTRRRRSLSERSLAVKRTLLSGLRIKKQHSTGDIHQRVTSMTGSLRSSGSTMSCTSEDSLHHHHKSFASTEEEAVDEAVTEFYSGEWKNDARSGFGVCERSDGLRYQGEWANNAKNGYGVTTLRDGTREEGKYKNNVLVVSSRRKGMLFVRSNKLKERVEAAVETANRAASIAQQKADIAVSRTSTAKERAEQAMFVAKQARDDAEMARMEAERFDPNFKPQGQERRRHYGENPGGDSFATDISDPHSSYSRHLSQTHSKHASFEQNLSVDIGDASYLTPMMPPTQAQMVIGATPPLQTSPHIGNHIGLQQAQMVNHVNFNLQSGMQTMHSGPHLHIHQENVMPENYAAPMQFEDVSNVGLLQDVAEVAEPPESQPTTTQASMLNASLMNNPQSSSRFSLSDDHFDQYVMAGTSGEQRLRRNRPSLMRQSDVNDATAMLNRRSTLASSRDRRAEPLQDSGENLGSLPNLAELESSGLRLRREDAARLASQRRQEILRDQEDQALLRANPLRYLFHPAFKAWLVRWKVPIFLAAANLTLLFLFYNLLTYDRRRR
ncbi:MORN repeat protein [Necator americanus]|uniref:MORN repeat protein n=1 Tax=Necator americanus TaxID=51031 RepID=W2STI6_NECAM|nr:MORN repeat protein [Necator americanus]ETN73069.1 MORN repeat protein [Necator americanus]